MIAVKKGDLIHVKVEFEHKDRFRKVVQGVIWDATLRCWVVPATISTFRNLRQFSPETMHPDKLTPNIRAWYEDLLARVRRLDELQRGIKRAPRLSEGGVSKGITGLEGEVRGNKRCEIYNREGLDGDSASTYSIPSSNKNEDTNANGSQTGGGGAARLPRNVEFPDGFIFAVPPFQHQREAIAFCINLDKSALWLNGPFCW